MNTSNQQHIAILLNSLSPTGGVERESIKCIEALAAKLKVVIVCCFNPLRR